MIEGSSGQFRFSFANNRVVNNIVYHAKLTVSKGEYRFGEFTNAIFNSIADAT